MTSPKDASSKHNDLSEENQGSGAGRSAPAAAQLELDALRAMLGVPQQTQRAQPVQGDRPDPDNPLPENPSRSINP